MIAQEVERNQLARAGDRSAQEAMFAPEEQETKPLKAASGRRLSLRHARSHATFYAIVHGYAGPAAEIVHSY